MFGFPQMGDSPWERSAVTVIFAGAIPPMHPLPGRQLSPRADAILFTDEEWTAWVPCKQALWRPSEDDLCAAFKPSASQHRPYECLEKALHVEEKAGPVDGPGSHVWVEALEEPSGSLEDRAPSVCQCSRHGRQPIRLSTSTLRSGRRAHRAHRMCRL